MLIPKIARGGSGGAEITGRQNTSGGMSHQLNYSPPPFWQIQRPGFGIACYHNLPWGVSEDVVVTVSPDAAFGVYEGLVYLNRQDTNGDGINDTGEEVSFTFEVVCLAVARLDVREVFRDQTNSRLSCTAIVQGGTAPYTYHWTGSAGTLVSGQGTATIEVEIPIDSTATFSVNVSDSGHYPCTDSASFTMCAYVHCDFLTSIVSTPPVGATGPYVYECLSVSQTIVNFVGHYWSPASSLVSANGRVARFSFPDDGEYSISLMVRDETDCYGFRTHKVGGYEFVVSIDPGGEHSGTITGTRDTMEFEVTVKAEATSHFTDPPPAQVTFVFFRAAINGVGTAVGTLVAGSNPSRYEFLWNVRQHKGRWQISVQNRRSNVATFKIDKRKQIVEVAKSWDGALQGAAGGIYCDDLARYVYGYVGLALAGGGNAVDDLYNSMVTTVQDFRPGSLAFYHFSTDNNTTWRHAGVKVGVADIVDQNCGLPHSVYPTYTDEFGTLQTDNNHPPTIKNHSDVDAALVNAAKYASPSYHTTAEMRLLDDE